jgi:hypothetical protein
LVINSRYSGNIDPLDIEVIENYLISVYSCFKNRTMPIAISRTNPI